MVKWLISAFSLFSCSSVLDSMLFKSTEPKDSPFQKTLLHNIVNPLRRSEGSSAGCFSTFLVVCDLALCLLAPVMDLWKDDTS